MIAQKLILSFFLLCCCFAGNTQDVVIQEVLYNTSIDDDKIMLCNTSDGEVDMTGWQLCSRFTYASLSSLTIESGSLPLAPGRCVTLSGFAFDDSAADVGLYSEASFSSSAAMVDFIQYGTADDVGRVDVAVAKGIWTENTAGVFDFVVTSANDESLQFDGENGGSGELSLSSDFSNAAPEFKSDPFITTWNVTANDTIIIPRQSGTYNFDYVWTLTTDNNIQISGTHTNADGDFETAFVDAGIYELGIRGDFPHLKDYPKDKLLDVLQWGDIEWRSMEKTFEKWQGATFSAVDAPDLSRVTSLNSTFDGASNFNGPIGNWDVSNITTLFRLFRVARNFNQDISNWDVSKVGNMNATFEEADNFNQDISNWDVSSVTALNFTFSRNDAFNQDIGKWNVSNVRSFRGTFREATAFNQSLGNWEFRQGSINIDSDAFSLPAMDCSNWSSTLIGWNTNNPEIRNLPIGGPTTNYNSDADVARDELIARGWTINNNGVNVGNCNTTIPFITTWRVNEIDTASNKLDSILIVLSSSHYYNFEYKWTLTTDRSVEIVGSHTSSDGDFETTFNHPGVYELEILGKFPRLFRYPKNLLLDVLQWGDNLWATMFNMFSGWPGAGFSATDAPNLTDVTSLQNMFLNATNFNENISHWDVSQVMDVRAVFKNAESFNQPLDSWDVSSVTRFEQAFAQMDTFDQPLGNWQFNPSANVSQFGSGTTSMSCENWSTTIRGWNLTNSNIVNLPIGGFVAEYDSLASIARDSLVARGWTISGTDIGGNCGSVDPCDNDILAPFIDDLADIRGECVVTILSAPVAIDLCQGEITGVTNDPLTYDEQGVYRVTWVFDDSVGNVDSAVQLVIVDDLTAPTPDISSLPDVTGECEVTVTAPKATDNCDGEIIGTTTDPISYNEQDTFKITWIYADDNGNSSSQTQTIILEDVTAPTITMNGAAMILVACDATSFEDPGATAADNCDGVAIETTGTVDINTPGTYTLTYKAVDIGGNESEEVTRTVVVPTEEECRNCIDVLIIAATDLAADPHASSFSADSIITIDGIITEGEQIILSAPNGIEFLGNESADFQVDQGATMDVNLDACSELLSNVISPQQKKR